MECYRIRATLRELKPPTRRTFLIPQDTSFIDLHLLIQSMAGWGDRYTHRFVVKDRKIGPEDFGVSEEAHEYLAEYADDFRPVYEYGPFTVDLMMLKGKAAESDFPVITESEELFPPDECKSLQEFIDVLDILDNPSDPSYKGISDWMKEVEETQDTDTLNKDFSENWERIGKISGRVPFNVAAAIGALLITGIDDYYYDTEKKRLTEESDGSKRFVPVNDTSGFVDTLVGMYSDLIGLKDATLDKLLEDEYRPGWEEYAENFLDEISDSWADGCIFIVESYADSDISKMMNVFEEKE